MIKEEEIEMSVIRPQRTFPLLIQKGNFKGLQPCVRRRSLINGWFISGILMTRVNFFWKYWGAETCDVDWKHTNICFVTLYPSWKIIMSYLSFPCISLSYKFKNHAVCSGTTIFKCSRLIPKIYPLFTNKIIHTPALIIRGFVFVLWLT